MFQNAAKQLPAKASDAIKTNLNSASEGDLERLPGIGPTQAKSIIAARPFNKVEDVMKVPGVSQAVFDKIKSRLSIK